MNVSYRWICLLTCVGCMLALNACKGETPPGTEISCSSPSDCDSGICGDDGFCEDESSDDPTTKDPPGSGTTKCGDGVVDDGELCDDGEDNGTPNHCDITCLRYVPSECGNGVQEKDEACDDGDDNGKPFKCNLTCDGTTAAVCGNGVVEEGEDCDEGGEETETCNADCTEALCGDGFLNEAAGEVCDDGDDNGGPNHCNADCSGITEAVCGNGVKEHGEECDEGQNEDTPTCTAVCTVSVCGDGYVNASAGETCDSGSTNGQPGECNLTCTGEVSATCGDGTVDSGEDCDSGGEDQADCNADCTAAVCGDGYMNSSAGELCDDGVNNGKPTYCNDTCTGLTPPVCGNNVVEAGESCDDGIDNGKPNHCSDACTGLTPPVCGNGIQEASEACDDGAENGEPGKCNFVCTGQTSATCGDGKVDAGEECDGGGIDTELCNIDCSLPTCGDGYINVEAGEVCDDGALNGEPNQCDSLCEGTTAAVCGNGVLEADEDCDEGHEQDTATCNADCSAATCGDGHVNAAAGEVCDDGTDNGKPNHCNGNCTGITSASCGNGTVESGEECDGGGEDTDTCNEDCTLAECGDGYTNEQAGETCDDGADNGKPNQCAADCSGTTASTCGNGIREAGESCDDGEDNGNPNKCATDCSGTTASICGNGIREAGESCDDGEDNGNPNKCATDCSGTTPATCGNSVVEDGETCDEGADNGSPLHCAINCQGTTPAVCGNGVKEAGESCDDGDDNGEPNMCNTSCNGLTGSVCGNGTKEAGEDCDDGGETATCNDNCTAASCGDGITNTAAGEICDDGPNNGKPNYCAADCSGTTAAVCGNGVKEAGEACDDQGESATCNVDCTTVSCGDGIINATAGEICDDGPDNGKPNQCAADCSGTTEALCGNGVKEAGEDCDDQGESATCNVDCTSVSCGDGVINATAGEICDDGPNNGNPNHCAADCSGTTEALCGNGVKEAGEDCDDQGESATCNVDCTTRRCGDGVVNTTAGETCDDGTDNGKPNKCNATCDGTTTPVCGNGVKEAGEDCDDGANNGTPGMCNNTCDGVTPTIQEPTAFRITSAKIIDPHMRYQYLVFGIGLKCETDITNQGVSIPLAGNVLPGGVNGMLNDALQDTENGNFKMSIVAVMRPEDHTPDAHIDMDLAFPICKDDHSMCEADTSPDAVPPVLTQITNKGSGRCLPMNNTDRPGRNSLYGDANDPQGPCFISEYNDVSLVIADIPIDLSNARIAAQYDGDPADGLVKGVLVGFLPKTTAQQAELEVDVVGKIKLSDVLGGGGGPCDNQNIGGGKTFKDDLDDLNGVDGWWMYLNFDATVVGQYVD